MININRNNYEKYFIDFMDGNLSQQEKEELFLFLNANPDLKEELESFDGELVLEGEVMFENKKVLLKKSVLDGVSSSNFDELCIASLENDLNASEETYFKEFINETRQKQKEFDLYKLTKLQVDEKIVFKQKQILKKSLKGNLRRNFAMIASAASVVVLIGLYFILQKQGAPFSEQLITETIEASTKEVNATRQGENIAQESIEKIDPINIHIANKQRIEKQLINHGLTNVKTDIEFIEKQGLKVEKLASVDIKLNFETDNKLEELSIIKVYQPGLDAERIEGEYLTFGSYISTTINEKVLNKKDKDKLEWFDIAQASVEGINKLTGSNMKLERKYDKNGNPNKTEFNSKLIAFSTPTKKD